MNTNSLCKIYIVRHGQTEWNVKRLIQGHKNSQLTKLGIEQAFAAAAKLQNIVFDEVYSSDLDRAHLTASIIAKEKQLVVKMTKLLREKSYGKYEGRGYDVFQSELKEYTDEFDKHPHDKKWSFKFPDIETDEEVVIRTLRFLREISIANPNKKVLVVTHAGVIGNLLIHLGVWDYPEQHTKKLANAGYLQLESDGIDFFVKEADGIDI